MSNQSNSNNKRFSQRIKAQGKAGEDWSSESEKDTARKQKQIRSQPTLQIKLKVQPQKQETRTETRTEPRTEVVKLPKDMDPEPVCPICLKIIIGDIDDINEHVDECIGPSSSNFTSGICTPQDEAQTQILSVPMPVTSLVNVDEDDFGYGKGQYTEADVERIIKADKTGFKGSESADKEETRNSLLIQGILSTVAPNSDFHSLQLAIKSLLDRIATAPKCAVCWETLKMPATVSVNCWHVCCEECWLRTLGTKRLCPHCSTITNPSDLRKVFF